jgi:ABC-2 type transport system permease protein
MLAFLALTCISFSLFGFIIGVWAKNFEQLQLVPLLIVSPLVFLGGVWYPIHVLPETVQWVGLMLPLPHLLQALRVTAMPGHDQVALGASAAVLVGWCLAGSVIAVVRFRWNNPQ